MPDLNDLMAGTAVPPMLAEAVLIYGRDYGRGTPEPVGKDRYCYHFAWSDPRPYVEGVIYPHLRATKKIPHAWVLNAFGLAVDLAPSALAASGYTGVRIDRQALAEGFPVLARAAAVAQWIDPRRRFTEALLARAEHLAPSDPEPQRGGVLACAPLVGVRLDELVAAGVLPDAKRRS